ncbi:MAG: hypothetical protein GX612_03585, partial [Bacteroidales bacterium]|nr:hypothetical protein [Bacteroidales bacterium]
DSLAQQIRVTVIATGLHEKTSDFSREEFTGTSNDNIKKIQIDQAFDNKTTPETKDNTSNKNVIGDGDVIDNNNLRDMTPEQIDEYLKLTPYERMKMKQHGSAFFEQETSNIRVGSNGMMENPPFLTNAVD